MSAFNDGRWVSSDNDYRNVRGFKNDNTTTRSDYQSKYTSFVKICELKFGGKEIFILKRRLTMVRQRCIPTGICTGQSEGWTANA